MCNGILCYNELKKKKKVKTINLDTKEQKIILKKDKEERIKNLDTLAEAHKAAEKIIRDKALKKFKSSKSDKDKMWEMIKKAQKKKEEDDKKKEEKKYI